jgi:hypothetical protein
VGILHHAFHVWEGGGVDERVAVGIEEGPVHASAAGLPVVVQPDVLPVASASWVTECAALAVIHTRSLGSDTV